MAIKRDRGEIAEILMDNGASTEMVMKVCTPLHALVMFDEDLCDRIQVRLNQFSMWPAT